MPVRDVDAALSAAISEWGNDLARPARADDAPDGSLALVVLEPRDAPTAAMMLKWADAERLSLAIRGGGTKSTWGTPQRTQLLLSTARLNEPIDHTPGDLTAIVAAGATLDAVNAVLGRARQSLPLDPPASARATIGGIVAANDSGPRRHRFGAPRDLIIGIELALVDGRIVKAGGRVVKNVAGYDLSRLMCGSLGTLALITSATFKLAPVAAASRTLVAAVPGEPALAQLLLSLTASPVTPTAVELDAPPVRLLVRYESTPRACDEQIAATSILCERVGASVEILTDEREADLWRRHETRTWEPGATIVKLTMLPSAVPGLLSRVDEDMTVALCGRAALGVLFLRLAGDPEAQVRMVSGLRREAAAGGGSAIVLTGGHAIKSRLEEPAAADGAAAVMRAVKARFDSRATLNPGRGVYETRRSSER